MRISKELHGARKRNYLFINIMALTNTQKEVMNFVYFSTNFPHNWVEQCFPGNQHIIDKWEQMNMVPARFILELDRTNQEVMLTWIRENYLAFQNLKV